MIITNKTCTKCGISKPLSEFYKQKECEYGVRPDCKECHNKRSIKYYQLHKDEVRQQQGKIPMSQNKDCSSYMGVFIGERLCRNLFKDVKVMPYGHSGFDIICNKGKKIDVKTSCISLNNNKHPRWIFHIDKNKIADYFILVAFDNRTDLNPIHMWMFSGNEINDKVSVSTCISKIHKWDKWKKDIDDAQLCCTEMKVVTNN